MSARLTRGRQELLEPGVVLHEKFLEILFRG
jgi:hypothetical protein